MPLQKYLDRLERLHLLIKRKATGTVDELADKLELSRRQTLEYISEMKEMGAPIQFCKYQQTYVYTRNVTFTIGFTDMTTNEIIVSHVGRTAPRPLAHA